jgi:hypothetical protein
MPSGPPKVLELLAGILLPPTCREEVLGDLHERYRNPAQYLGDVIGTAPFILLSQVRRRADMQFLILDASLIYACFLAAAWYRDKALLSKQAGLLHLAISAGITLAYLLLAEVFYWPVTSTSKWNSFAVQFAVNLVFFNLLCFVVIPRLDVFGFFAAMALHIALRWAFSPGDQTLQNAGGPSIRMRDKLALLERSRGGKLLLDIAITILCLAVLVVILWAGHLLKEHRS